MQDKQRKQRQAKRAEAKRKKRADASRPGVGGPAPAGGDTGASKGRTWPTGECYVSEGWDEPGARVEAVFSRCRGEGAAVVAVFEIDRSGPGILAARARGGLRTEHVAGECAALSERTGRAMIGCSPALVAALVDDARQHGTSSAVGGEALKLLEGVPRAELPVPFGPALSVDVPSEGPAGEGWLGGLKKRIFGST